MSFGCGGSTAGSVAVKSPEGEALPSTFEHEACDVQSSDAEKVDVNGDGKPDMIRVKSGGREVCRMLDFNHDGIPDTYVYTDEQGRPRRRESDFDRDGKVDEVDVFANGVIVRKDRATSLDGKFHTWDFYQAGKIHHRLRDADGDGKVDEWWSWANPDKIECAVIMNDVNGDGKPDSSTAIDQCAATSTASATPAGGASAAPAGSSPAAPAASSAAPAEASAAPAAAAKGAAAANPDPSSSKKGTANASPAARKGKP